MRTTELVPRKEKLTLGLTAEEIDEVILLYLQSSGNVQALSNRLRRPIPWVGKFLKNEIVRSRMHVLNDLHQQSLTAKMVASLGEVKVKLTTTMRGDAHATRMAKVMEAAEKQPYVEVASKGEVVRLERDRVALLLEIDSQDTKAEAIQRAAAMDLAKITGALDPKSPAPKSRKEMVDKLIRNMLRAGIRPSEFRAKLNAGKPIDVDFIPESGDSGSSPNSPA